MHPSFRKNRESIIEDAIDEGVSKFIITGTNVKASQIACEYASNYPGTLYSTSGVHPHDAKTCDDNTLFDADSGYQNRDGGNASQGSVGNLFDNNTHQRADYNRCQNADSEISARRQRCENGICADHDDIAVGKVEHLRDAVNHRLCTNKEYALAFC